MYVHFGPKASNIKNGSLTPLNLGYWKCLLFEAKFLVVRLFDTPMIGQHYMPHTFAWITAIVLLFVSVHHFILHFFQ